MFCIASLATINYSFSRFGFMLDAKICHSVFEHAFINMAVQGSLKLLGISFVLSFYIRGSVFSWSVFMQPLFLISLLF